VPDTGEDDEVTLDIRVPAQSQAHAEDLAQAISMVELEHFGSRGWLSWVRRMLIRAIRWVNDRDPRTMLF
jgi:hypothetical protein